jgi:hypothetical protein
MVLISNSLPSELMPDEETVAKVVEMTCELFGGDVSLYESFYPEHPTDRYPVISVTTRLSPKEAVRTESVWIHRIMEIAPDWKDLCLGVRFAE